MKTSTNIITFPYRKADLTTSFLRGRNKLTSRAYERDLDDFRAWINADNIEEALKILLKGHGDANSLILDYRGSLFDRGLSPASINRKLSTLRSLVRLARSLGIVTWGLEIENIRTVSYRDTRGPGLSGYRLLLDASRKIKGPKGTRDQAILRLLFDLALRRAEIVSLDLADVDLPMGRLLILGKGRSQREALTMPAETLATLSRWIETRGTVPGPLFTNLDPGHKERTRLTGNGLYRIVHTLGKRVGLNVHPHSIRHSSITVALDMTKGDLRTVARFSRHKNIQTLTIYDDNRMDLAGGIARMLAGIFESAP